MKNAIIGARVSNRAVAPRIWKLPVAERTDFAERVRAGLARGRQRAIEYQRERAAPTERAVRRELDLDILRGHSERGRAERIAGALRGRLKIRAGNGMIRTSITPRGVRKILERLFRCSEPRR